jgi:hypothetical protein
MISVFAHTIWLPRLHRAVPSASLDESSRVFTCQDYLSSFFLYVKCCPAKGVCYNKNELLDFDKYYD